MKISIVVCAYNEEATVLRCLEGLRRQVGVSPSDYEVLVVDDGSTDRTGRLVEQFIEHHRGLPSTSYVASRHLGLSVARNTGVFLSAAPLVAFVDADAEPHERWVCELLRAWEIHPRADAIGGRIRIRNGASGVARFLHCVYYDPLDRIAIIGANMAFRRERLVEVGGFCDHFVSRGDDTYVLLKMGPSRQEVKWAEAIVYHDRPTTLRQWLKERVSNGEMCRLIDRMTGRASVPWASFLGRRLVVVGAVVGAMLMGWVGAALAGAGCLAWLGRRLWSRGDVAALRNQYGWLVAIPLALSWGVLEEAGGWAFLAGWRRGASLTFAPAKVSVGTLSAEPIIRTVRTT